jgi:hypothetical protein
MGELISHTNNLPAQLSPKEIAMCQALHVFNQLRDFKLDALQVVEWKDTIVRIRPDVEPEVLLMAIDALISGDVDYEPKEGIHNIIRALKRVWRDEQTGKLTILKPVY